MLKCPKCGGPYSASGLTNHIDRTPCQVTRITNGVIRRGLQIVWDKQVCAVLRAVGALEYHITAFRPGGSHVPGGASVQAWANTELVAVVNAALEPWPSFYGLVALPPQRRLDHAIYTLEEYLCHRNDFPASPPAKKRPSTKTG